MRSDIQIIKAHHMLAHLSNDRNIQFGNMFLLCFCGIIKICLFLISAFSHSSVSALTVASVCCAEIERLWRAREQTPEIHPSQSEATADTLQRGTINKGIIQQ